MQYRINKHKSLWRKAYLKTAGVSVLALTLVLQPLYTVAAFQSTEYVGVEFTESELDDNWVSDRTAPSGGRDIVEYGGRQNVLALKVDPDDRSTAGTHYYTEGIKRDIPASDSIKADLFVDSEWQNKQVRAGLWGVGENDSGDVTAYPILEFASIDGAQTGWRAWTGVSPGGWTQLRTEFGWDTWNTLEITLDDTDGSFDSKINGQVVATNSQSAANTNIGAVILNSYNFGQQGDTYTVHWSNVAYGDIVELSAVPTNLRFSNPELACGASTKRYSVTPTWDNADGAVKYEYSVITPGVHNASNPWVTTVSTNSYPGAFTEGEGVYTFKVRGISTDNRKSDWSETCSVTYDKTAPTTPTQLAPVDRGFARVNDFYFDWTDSIDATALTYEFQSSQNPATSNGVLTTGVWNNIINGNAEQKNLTDSKIRSVGANGTWYWQVRAIDAGGNKSAWSPTWKLTIDMQKPVANITYPAQGQYVRTFNVGNVLSVKGLVTDANPNYAYVQLLNNMNGSIAPKTIYGAFSSGSELTTFDTTALADGKYGLNISAADGAGNVYNFRNETGVYRTFFLDNTRPVVTVNTPQGSVNPENISVTATDNMKLQLVTANIYKNSTLVRSCSKNIESLAVKEYTLDTCSTAGLADGTYSLKANALDAAGTISHTVTTFSFVIDNTVPVVTPEDFGVGSWTLASDGFTGINVGFNIRDFGSVSGIKVTVERATGEEVSVDATQALIDKINDDNLLQLSAPFAVNGAIGDDTWCNGSACWTSPVALWNETTLPERAKITVEGTNTRGEPTTRVVYTTMFSQAGGSYVEILPQQQAPAANGPSIQGVSSLTPAATGGSQQGGGSSFARTNLQGGSFAREYASTRGNTPQPADVVLPPVSESGVLAAKTSVDEDLMYASGISDEEEAGGKYMQYWWVPLVSIAAIAGVWALVASRRKRHDDQ